MTKRSYTSLTTIVCTLLLTATCAASPDNNFTISGTGGDCNNIVGYEGLFSEACRFENFRNFHRFGPMKTIPASSSPIHSEEAIESIEFSHSFKGQEMSLSQFLEATSTTGFIVQRNGKIIDERYYHGNRPSARHAGFSMTKSVVSALVGAALDDGSIRSINDPITDYIPALTSPTYIDVSIKHVLQMSSGIQFNEDYSDPDSDINRMSHLVQKMSYIDYFNTLERAHTPGTYNLYASINTHILGELVANATGENLSDYLYEKIWQPMGMQFNAEWMVDNEGKELPMGGLAITLRDWARFGELYANEGIWKGKQVLPAEWIKESTTSSEPHLQPGPNEKSNYEYGYQYQWWTPRNTQGDFMALGIWGQTLYVNPSHGIVIVKLSADAGSFDANNEYKVTEYLQALSESLAGGS